MVSLRLASNGCQYSEMSTLPADFAAHHAEFRHYLAIRCSEFSAILGALTSDPDKP